MLIQHIKTQSTAVDHALLGAIGSVTLGGFPMVFSGNLTVSLLLFVAGGLLVGIGIELVQRVQRAGGSQNTIRESVLDALMTGCWPLVFWLRRKG